MLDRLWLAAITVLIAGWVILLLSPGSRFAGIAVYGATAVLLVLGLVAVTRWLSGHMRSE